MYYLGILDFSDVRYNGFILFSVDKFTKPLKQQAARQHMLPWFNHGPEMMLARR